MFRLVLTISCWNTHYFQALEIIPHLASALQTQALSLCLRGTHKLANQSKCCSIELKQKVWKCCNSGYKGSVLKGMAKMIPPQFTQKHTKTTCPKQRRLWLGLVTYIVLHLGATRPSIRGPPEENNINLKPEQVKPQKSGSLAKKNRFQCHAEG